MLPVAVTSVGQLLVRGFDLLVDDGEFVDQLGGELAAGLADDVTGAGRGAQQGAGLAAGEELLRPAGDQLQQQVVHAG